MSVKTELTTTNTFMYINSGHKEAPLSSRGKVKHMQFVAAECFEPFKGYRPNQLYL